MSEVISKRIAVVLVLDCSSSMGNAFEPMKAAAIDFVETMEEMETDTTQTNIPNLEVPTNEELWSEFKRYYSTWYNETRADQEIGAVSTFMTKGCDLMTNAKSEYKWLGDYIMAVSAEQGITLTSNPSDAGMEALWRWSVHSFFNCNKRTSWPITADFSTAGKPESWGNAWKTAQ